MAENKHIVIWSILAVVVVGAVVGVAYHFINAALKESQSDGANGDFVVSIYFPQKPWDPDYENNKSPAFIGLAQNISKDMAYAFNASFIQGVVSDTTVTGLSKGSVKAEITLVVAKLSYSISDASGNSVDVKLETEDIKSALREGVTVLLGNDPSSVFSEADMNSIEVQKITDKDEIVNEECVSKTDVMFLLDESGSIGKSNFITLKLFVSEFASKSDINENAIQMGVATFNSYATGQFKLNEYKTAGEIVIALNAVGFSSGGTNIGEGLQFVYNSSYKTENGGRTDAFKVLVLMTDGDSSDASYKAGLLKNSGVTIICIGIGSGIKLDHLERLASRESLVFHASNFNTLSTVQSATLQSSCDASFTELGDVNKLKPTGKKVGGVSASEADVNYDVTEIMKRKACFLSAGRANGLHPALIAAIASRESRAGRLLTTTNGWGDNSNAYGILQCDKNACPVCTYGFQCTTYTWDSCEHIRMMTNYVLVPFIRQVQNKHPNWLPEQQLQGGVAAYNFGVQNVQTWNDLDTGTTGNDYSNDVVARAQYLIKNYQW